MQLVADGVVLDAVGYGDFAPENVFAGEGTPAPDVPAGSSLARIFANVDTGDNALDFAVLGLPTPGAVALLPEPGSATLLAFAVVALALLHRRRGPERVLRAPATDLAASSGHRRLGSRSPAPSQPV